MSETVDRRTFVGLSAGAAVAPAAVATALAQNALGKPHPPLVAENDPAIRTATGHLTVAGRTISAYVAHPANGPATTPSIVMAMHIWGVDASMRDTARRLAKAGYAAIIPNLFELVTDNPPSGDGSTDYRTFSPLAAKLDAGQVDAALQSAAADIKGAFAQGKQATWGFCMGGTIALKQAVAHPETYSAAAIFYGNPKDVDPKAMKVPMAGSYGGKDTGIPADSVRKFADALPVPHDIKIYPEAGHAFFDDQRASYVESAATDAWQRTLAFLGKYLGTG
jgi:carboxymethylenebutenolidase